MELWSCGGLKLHFFVILVDEKTLGFVRDLHLISLTLIYKMHVLLHAELTCSNLPLIYACPFFSFSGCHLMTTCYSSMFLFTRV